MSNVAQVLEDQRDVLVRQWRARMRGVKEHSDDPDALDDVQIARMIAELRKALYGPVSSVSTGPSRPRGAGGDPPAASCASRSGSALKFRYFRDCLFDVLEELGCSISSSEARILTAFFAEGVSGARDGDERPRIAQDVGVSPAPSVGPVSQWIDDGLHVVVDELPVLVSFVTADERYGLVNKAYENWFGVSRDALIGQPLREVIGEAAYETMRPHIKRALAGDAFTFEQYSVPYRLGGTRDVKVTFVPRYRSLGHVEGFAALVEDISRRRHLEHESHRLSLQRNEVLSSMGDAFFAVDREWRIILVNEHYERVSRKAREEMLGRVFWELFPDAATPASHYFQAYQRCMTERVSVNFVDYYRSLDLWTDVRAYPTADGGIAVFFRDVSTERRAEEALKRQAGFEQQLIGIVSHDLRNPLNVILMGTELLKDDETLRKSASDVVVRIQNATTRAVRMVRDLLDLTQARLGGGIPLERRLTDFHVVVHTVIDEMAVAYPSREICERLDRDGNSEGMWDPDRLAQFIQNLISNALEYSRAGSPVSLRTQCSQDDITLTVHNDGAPIPPEKLPDLFEPLQRAGKQLDPASRSVGLGLYIVKQVIDGHGGTVKVESSESNGTTFTVVLPRDATNQCSRTFKNRIPE